MYYASLSVYNQCVYDKQMHHLTFLSHDFTNNDIEKLLGFDAQQRQHFIHEKFQNTVNTQSANTSLQRIENIKDQRHEMQKVSESVNEMKQLDRTLHELAIDLPAANSSKKARKMKQQQAVHRPLEDVSMDEMDEMDEDEQLGVSGGILADFKQSHMGSRATNEFAEAPFTKKEVAKGRVILAINEGEDGDERVESEEEKRRRLRRRGCKIWCLVMLFIVFVVTFAVVDMLSNDRWF
mmetsp:Transcript_65543/g.104379  ORF Transcript_65543/g.104379 Transcript_65543/m.104379 type:complete len:237 (-) Transcript_65543:176-886(-)